MSDSTWTVEHCEYHPLYKPDDVIPDNSMNKKLIFARRHSREKSSRRRPHCKSCSGRIDRETSTGKSLESIHEELDELVRGYGKDPLEELGPIESSSASGAAGSRAWTAASFMQSVPLVFVTTPFDPLSAVPGVCGRSDLPTTMAMPMSTVNSSANQPLIKANIQPSNGPPNGPTANAAPAQAPAQAPDQGAPAQGSPAQHQQQQDKEEAAEAKAEAAEARAKAAEARAEAAEARADEAEGSIVELNKKMVDEAHRIAFQQRIFNMELVQLEQDLDETRRSAVQQDKANGDIINKLANYNDEAVQMINQLRQQIKSALPTGSAKHPKPSAAACSSSMATSAPPAGSGKNPKPSAAACSSSVAASALPATSEKHQGKRARSDNTVAPASKPAGLSATAKGSHPPGKVGRLYDAPPIVGKHCSFCRQSDCAQGGDLHQCKAMNCMRLWSDRCIGRYAGDDDQKMCFHHAKCVHHDQTNCPECVRNCMPAVYEPLD